MKGDPVGEVETEKKGGEEHLDAIHVLVGRALVHGIRPHAAMEEEALLLEGSERLGEGVLWVGPQQHLSSTTI